MNTQKIFRIGTRGSELALAQATLFEVAVRSALPDVQLERVVIHTTGDKRQDLRLAELSGASGSPVDKGIFTKELESALAARQIDIAVHSLKDVPTEIASEFVVVGTMLRAAVEDVLLSPQLLADGIASLAHGAIVATSSIRRHCQLLAARPDLRVAEIRGNVPTRLRKLHAGGNGDALVLARAGLERLGWNPSAGSVAIDGGHLHAVILPEREMMPAAGQGAIGLEIRNGDQDAAALVAAVNHIPSWARVCCEREFLRLLEAGCHTPVGISTVISVDNILTAAAVVFDAPGGVARRAAASGPASNPLAVAGDLFLQLSN